jgi:hypothetical protein
VIIDVDGDGYSMTSGSGGVVFDIAANGKPMRISWTAAGVDDAWLAFDRNSNGRIDSGKELFGEATPQPDGQGERQGFKALAVFDQTAQGGNSNGWIDPPDSVYRKLYVWQDRNHNGVSEPAELLRLDPLGITAISLDYKESKWVDIYGNQFRYRAKVMREGRGKGRNKWAYDVFLVRGE